MKKRVILLIVIFVFTTAFITTAFAANPGETADPQSSLYLVSYGVDLLPLSNGQMAVEMSVNATGYMLQLGVQELYIEHKINGVWQEFDTVYGIFHSDFFEYNDYTYLGEYFFNGVSGRQYRVTMTAYARNSNGSDTGEVMSGAATCHNP